MGICWSPIISGTVIAVNSATATIRGSFGLSIAESAAAMGKAGTETRCSLDYIVIPNGLVGVNKFCGRYLNADGGQFDGTVCSRITPFSLSVITNGNEVLTDAVAAGAADANEASAAAANTPTATMGFSLGFNQIACT